MQDVIALVRKYTRDYPELNRLIQGVESSDPDISTAIQFALDDWNITPPLLASVTLETHPSRSLLVMCVTCYLLDELILLSTRNHLSYSDGQGTSVNVSDKAPMLQGIQRLIQGRYENMKMRWKVAKNIDDGWGSGAVSEYSGLG